jgi:hypothetical protein
MEPLSLLFANELKKTYLYRFTLLFVGLVTTLLVVLECRKFHFIKKKVTGLPIHDNRDNIHQFLASHPKEEVEYRVFSQRCGRVVESFLNIGSVHTYRQVYLLYVL